MSPAEIERKAFDLMASSIRRYRFVEDWELEGESVKLPFETPAKPGDEFVFRTEIDVPRDGLAWFFKICMDGNALIKVDGQSYAGIDDVHTYIPLPPGRHKIELVATPLTMFGYHKWRFKFEYSMLVGILWDPYVLAQRLLDLVSFIEVVKEEEVRNAILKELSKILVRVKTVPSITQITLLRMLWHDGGLGIKELRIGRFDVRDVRPDYMFLSAVYGFGILKGYLKDILKPERAGYLREIRRVEEELRRALSKLKMEFPKMGKAYAFGHAHIDAAWLWTYDETKRKILRTFSTAVRILKKYNISFVQSSAQYYEWVEKEDPRLFEEIRKLVKAGKWIPVGGMWVESDVQLVDGESLVRQFLYGQRYFKERFGRICKIGWLPDTFGFSASLPQIMRKCGIEAFATYKLLWNERNEFPYHAFIWKGIDGTEIPVQIMMSYKASMTAKSLYQHWKMYKNKHEAPFLLYAYGYGDGGGGITFEMAEMQRRMNEVPYIPKVVRGREDEYIRELKGCKELPTWEGELYVEAHRGTYTTNIQMKELMVKAESSLRSAEIWCSIAEMLGKIRYPEEEIRELWKTVLLHQFHDVLPGSSIKEVYDWAISDLKDVIERAERLTEVALKSISDGRTLVFNDLPWERVELVRIGGREVIVRAVPMGWCKPEEVEGWVKVEEDDGKIVLENEYIRAVVNEDGELISLFDKENNREALRGVSNVLMAHVDTPGMWDAWDVNEDFLIQGTKLKTVEKARVVRRDDKVCEVKVVKGYENSKLVQIIRLKAKSRLLEFDTEVDWNDKEVLLKAWFNFNVHNWSSFYEIPYGVIERPAVRNTPWEQAKFEVPALRWADVSDGEYGVAVICTSRHGYTNWDSKIGISLLKSPIYPNPWSDLGKGHFIYYLYPHTGDWYEGEVYKRAMEVWSPLRIVEGKEERSSWSLMECSCYVHLKKAEDGDGYVIRICNPSKGEMVLKLPFKAYESDMLEFERGKVVENVKLGPFEICTLIIPEDVLRE